MTTIYSSTGFSSYNTALNIVSVLWEKPVKTFFYPLTGRCQMNWKSYCMASGTVISITGMVITLFAGAPLYCAGFTIFFVCTLIGHTLNQKIQELLPLNETSGRLGVAATQLENVRQELWNEVSALNNTNESLLTQSSLFQQENDRLSEMNTSFEKRLDLFENANDRLATKVEEFDRLSISFEQRKTEMANLTVNLSTTQGRLEELTTQLDQIRLAIDEAKNSLTIETQALTHEREALSVVRKQISTLTTDLINAQSPPLLLQ